MEKGHEGDCFGSCVDRSMCGTGRWAFHSRCEHDEHDTTGMAGKVIREGKGEGGHAEQRWQAKRASRIHKRSGAALRGRVMSPCSKHTFVCAYFYVQLFLDQAGSWAWG